MTDIQTMKLEYPFQPHEIEWRVLRTNKDRTKGQVAAFVDSRAIQKRLDETLGRENWQNHFSTAPGKDTHSTTYICEISIYYRDKKEWITKSDGAGCTDVEPVKGGLSNAFKRAASMWSIGRYLYELKNIWVALDEGKYISSTEKPKLDQKYVEFVNRYLAAKKKSSPSKEDSPSSVAQVPKTSPDVSTATPKSSQPVSQILNGRFQTAPPHNGCRITDLKVTRGAKSSQTLVTLLTPQGQSISGYIYGTPDLKTGQNIYNPKIVTKTAPQIGQYHIIESYDLAA